MTIATSLATEDFNLADPEIQKDPYPFYPMLRARRPVLRTSVGGQDCWVLSRRADIVKVLMDPRTFSNRHTPLPNMLFSDPPEHERLRRMVGTMFTRIAVQPMAHGIAQFAGGLIDAGFARGHLDVIEDFAGPLSIEAIGALLGISGLHVEKLRGLSHHFVAYVRALQLGIAPSEEARTATEELKRFVVGLIETRGYVDGQVLSGLAEEHRNGALSDEELVNFAILLLVAGHSTTTNLIGNSIFMLLQRPQDQDRIADEEGFAARFLEEVLRTRPSFHRIHRITTRPVEIAGEPIPEGAIVRLMLASANRDPEFFENPEVFDPDVKRRTNSAFGQGIHSCLGNWLARLEASTAIRALAQKASEIRADPHRPAQPHTGGSFNEFGFDALPIVMTPRV